MAKIKTTTTKTEWITREIKVHDILPVAKNETLISEKIQNDNVVITVERRIPISAVVKIGKDEEIQDQYVSDGVLSLATSRDA